METGGDPLLRCLTEVTSLLDQRKRDIAYLEDVITSDSLMTVDHPQVRVMPLDFWLYLVCGCVDVANDFRHVTSELYSCTRDYAYYKHRLSAKGLVLGVTKHIGV